MPPAGSSTKASAKTSPKSRIVSLQLPATLLARFPSDVTNSSTAKSSAATSKKSSSSSSASSAPSSASTPAANPPPAAAAPSPSAQPSDSNAPTPAAVNGAPPAPDANGLAPPPATNGTTTKRKGIPGPKPGSKRAPALGPDGLPKPRGKPGPKKKPRLDDPSAPQPAIAQKLGPKANQGAINAGLRALDRSGKACRKWERKGFQVKSFTGVVWSVPSWRAPKKQLALPATDENAVAVNGVSAPNGEVKSDITALSGALQLPSDLQGGGGSNNVGSSAVASEKSNAGGDPDTPMGGTSAAGNNGQGAEAASSPAVQPVEATA
ncbi:INO80 complex subunit Ies4-domain-containing protein [Lineolata rhizophorae]|uniref:INO80 complex subunit Ies4-domain-containing protein n=1 Tax=Lineolata rhizophorae TaxID=578093 RepID=A0A6A6NNZ9_9PEZI|nr:INO80 complex subunit Ies4-domain-containing protein [Lineolata rhizophorae]